MRNLLNLAGPHQGTFGAEEPFFDRVFCELQDDAEKIKIGHSDIVIHFARNGQEVVYPLAFATLIDCFRKDLNEGDQRLILGIPLRHRKI